MEVYHQIGRLATFHSQPISYDAYVCLRILAKGLGFYSTKSPIVSSVLHKVQEMLRSSVVTSSGMKFEFL